MTSVDELRQIAARCDPQFFECVAEWRRLLDSEQLKFLGSGSGSAQALHATFSLREKTTRAAGIASCGFAATLQQLGRLAPSTEVVTFAFKSQNGPLLVLFMTSEAPRLVGCVRVQRGEPPPTLKDQGLA